MSEKLSDQNKTNILVGLTRNLVWFLTIGQMGQAPFEPLKRSMLREFGQQSLADQAAERRVQNSNDK